jgi:hypothetical protein
MNKNVLMVIAVIALAASIFMKIESRNSHLRELGSYWWIPIPIALLCIIGASVKKKA